MAHFEFPECRSQDEFKVHGRQEVVITVTGKMSVTRTQKRKGTERWDPDSTIICCACNHQGELKEFLIY